MHLVDSHAHLNDTRFNNDYSEVLQRALEAGVRTVVNVGYDLSSSIRAVEMAQHHPQLYAAVGLHPHDARLMTPDLRRQYTDIAAQPKVVAIGESGLDYYRDLSPREVQREVFAEFITVAAATNLPLIVHCRDAQKDILEVLDRHLQDGQRVIMHCFAGDAIFAEECVARGFLLGFAGPVTYPRSDDLRQAARIIPPGNLLLETDCPWLAPQDRRGKRNEPAFMVTICEQIAAVRGTDARDIAAVTTANACRLFGFDSENSPTSSGEGACAHDLTP